MFGATKELLRLLSRSMNKGNDPINLNFQLQRRLVSAAMDCPGLTVAMKDDVAYIMEMSEQRMSYYNLPRNAFTWRHQFAIAPKTGPTGAPADVIEVRISIPSPLIPVLGLS